MHKEIVINTGPVIAIIAAIGDLSILKYLYKNVYITYEVEKEILFQGANKFGTKEFKGASFLKRINKPIKISPFLTNSLDSGEASVIQFAIDKKINIVCIDESVGRRIARLNNLEITGSVGVLLKAKKEGHLSSIKEAMKRMKNTGVFLSDTVIEFALNKAGE